MRAEVLQVMVGGGECGDRLVLERCDGIAHFRCGLGVTFLLPLAPTQRCVIHWWRHGTLCVLACRDLHALWTCHCFFPLPSLLANC